MEKVYIEKLDLTYYKKTLDCGLAVYLCSDDRFTSSYALFGTDYGSIDNCFKLEDEDEFTTVPDGIAHFLEHKLFESPDHDAFELFSNIGANSNAYTSFDKTCYLYSAVNDWDKSLEILLDFVQNPYFTDKTVEKEQGIIASEIKMYDDHPGWQVSFSLLGNLYHDHSVKTDIAGTVESISKITPELLYRCYNVFYSAKNMCLVLSGNFDVDKAFEIIEKEIKFKDAKALERKYADEKREIVRGYSEKKLPVMLPLFALGFKEVPDSEEVALRGQIINSMILDIAVSSYSKLYCDMYEQSLLSNSLGTEVMFGRGYLANIIEGESKNVAEVVQRIHERFADMRQNGIDEEDFQIAKKSVYANIVKSSASVEAIARNIMAAHFENYLLEEELSIIANIKKEELEERLQTSFLKEFSSVSVVKE